MGEGYNLPPFFMSDENKLLNKINRAMSGGNFSSAIESLDKVLSKKPSNLNLLMLRGEAHLRLENFESALRDLAKVVEADNKNITALVNFSVALIRCSMQNDAKPVLRGCGALMGAYSRATIAASLERSKRKFRPAVPIKSS